MAKGSQATTRDLRFGGGRTPGRGNAFVVIDPPFKPKRFTIAQVREAVRKVNEAQGYKPK